MNIAQAIKKLSKLGFEFPAEHVNSDNAWGKTMFELHDTRPHHFQPRWRDVFIGKCVDGWYITSHIKGKMRHYRCRHWNETDILNIFGGGATLAEAVSVFARNFHTKTYNQSRA